MSVSGSTHVVDVEGLHLQLPLSSPTTSRLSHLLTPCPMTLTNLWTELYSAWPFVTPPCRHYDITVGEYQRRIVPKHTRIRVDNVEQLFRRLLVLVYLFIVGKEVPFGP